MSGKGTTQNALLAAITKRLIEVESDFNENNCWLSDQAVPTAIPNGRWAVTVSVGPGSFPNEFFAGAGIGTLVEDGSIIVAPLVVTTADQPQRAWKKIGGAEANAGDAPTLLSLKLKILKALLKDDWSPEDNDQLIVRDMIAPLSCTEPRDVRVGQTTAAMIQLRFSTVFDWDLSL